ncbi:D-threo-3-hydroxyaspartate dehydratase-like isoform X2 [Anneissia japonica]|nr:D-threo-3-hydroxyaspartate dehydratase-like isoform X2 [Anneissia japonica]
MEGMAEFSCLQSPSFVVDINKVKQNAQQMLERCQELGVNLRPHTKTHKTLQAAEISTGKRKQGLVVSTIAEAKYFINGGFTDIIFAQPPSLTKVQVCAALVESVSEFHMLIDNVQHLYMLEDTKLLNGKHWSVFLDLDCGYGRTGAKWDVVGTLELARLIHQSESVDFSGVYVHEGNSYCQGSANEVTNISELTTSRLLEFTDKLECEGIPCPVKTMGSTPSCSLPAQIMSKITEFHPGNYVFYDLMQYYIGSCTLDDIACSVIARVIGHYPERGHMIMDCGWTALDNQSEMSKCVTGHGYIVGEPNLRIDSMTQELGKISAIAGKLDYEKYPIGTVLQIYPWHACATASLHNVYHIASDGVIIDKWKPVRGWVE